MSDFLTRLAERSLGEAPVIRPRLPGLFAPLDDGAMEGGEAAADDLHERLPAHAAAPRTAHAREETVDAAGAKRAWPPALPAAGEQPSETVLTRKTPQQATRAGGGDEEAPGSARPMREPPLAARRFTGERPDISGSSPVPLLEKTSPGEQLAPAPLLVAQPRERAGATGSAANRADAIALLDREPAQAPAVHITIGRVEVRATLAAPPPAARPRPEHKPALSLSDYLKRGGAKP